MEKKNLIGEIKKHVGSDRLNEAFLLLKTYLKQKQKGNSTANLSNQTLDQFLMINARFNQLANQEIEGVINSSNYNIELSKIRKSFLGLLTIIQEEDILSGELKIKETGSTQNELESIEFTESQSSFGKQKGKSIQGNPLINKVIEQLGQAESNHSIERIDKTLQKLKVNEGDIGFWKMAADWIDDYGKEFGRSALNHVCKNSNHIYCKKEKPRSDLIYCINEVINSISYFLSCGMNPEILIVIEELEEDQKLKPEYYLVLSKIFFRISTQLNSVQNKNKDESQKKILDLFQNKIKGYYNHFSVGH